MLDGVKVFPLVTHNDSRGFFREVVRFPNDFGGVSVGQLSHSFIHPGVTKGWCGHKTQSQWNYVIEGKTNVTLYDNRPDSLTYKETLKIKTGGKSSPVVYFFPPGILQKYRCVEGPVHIIYVTSATYDPTEEIRLLELPK